MVGNAVDTIVPSTALRKMPDSSPTMIILIWRGVRLAGGDVVSGDVVSGDVVDAVKGDFRSRSPAGRSRVL